jgi:hypothetical protein
LQAALTSILQVVKPSQTFILADEDRWGITSPFASRRKLPFLERDNLFWGAPAVDAVAISELERMVQSFAPSHLVIGWPAFWWLEHYSEFTRYLEVSFPCVLRSENVQVFDLSKRLP